MGELADARSELLLIGGRSGSGKTRVAGELHTLLAADDVWHAVVEGDYLDLAHPAPWVHRLAERNLAAVWANYRALGYRRLVYTNTVAPLEAGALAAAMGDDPVVTSVLLVAGDATVTTRLGSREAGAVFAAHLERSRTAASRLERVCGPEVRRIATDGRSSAEVAHDIRMLLAW